MLTDLDLTLTEPGGAMLDDKAKALDVSPEGFKLITRAKVERGRHLRFLLDVRDGPPVSGEIELVWARVDSMGGCEAGARFLNISWSDARRLRSRVYTPGFDFTSLAWLAAKGVFLAVLVVGLQQVFFNEPHYRQALLDALPAVMIVVVAVVLVLSILRG